MRKFGRYQIVEELGRGGMRKVYKAYGSVLNRYIALKLVVSKKAKNQDKVAKNRFQLKSKVKKKNYTIYHQLKEKFGILQ